MQITNKTMSIVIKNRHNYIIIIRTNNTNKNTYNINNNNYKTDNKNPTIR